MSTHNICFRGEIRKILCGYHLLSVAMVFIHSSFYHCLSVCLHASIGSFNDLYRVHVKRHYTD